MRIITDIDTVRLTAEGDVNTEYYWFNQYNDLLGVGNNVEASFTRYGQIDVTLVTRKANGQSSRVERLNQFVVQNNRVNSWIDEKVNPQIDLTGGVLDSSYVDAVSNIVTTFLYRTTNGSKLMDLAWFTPVLPVSPEVAALCFGNYVSVGNIQGDLTLYNSPIIQNGYLYFNGDNQCAYTEFQSVNMLHGYGGVMLSYVGAGTELEKYWTFARNNNGNRYQIRSRAGGKEINLSTRFSGLCGSEFGKANCFEVVDPSRGRRNVEQWFFAGESNDSPSSIYPDVSPRRNLVGGSNARHNVGVNEGTGISETGADMVNFCELEYGGEFISAAQIAPEDIPIINAAWEKYQLDLGRQVNY